jgi:hypothetical protein
MKWAAREGVAEWLTMYSWTYFVTLTFRKSCNPDSALKRSLKFLANTGVVRAAVFVEPHQSGDPHVHALVFYGDALPGMASVGQIASTTLCDLWFQSPGGGLARASVVRSCASASHYVAKYVTKCTDEREFPWTLSGPAHAWKFGQGMRKDIEKWERSQHSRHSRSTSEGTRPELLREESPVVDVGAAAEGLARLKRAS